MESLIKIKILGPPSFLRNSNSKGKDSQLILMLVVFMDTVRTELDVLKPKSTYLAKFFNKANFLQL